MRLARPEVLLEKRADGSMLLRSPQKLGRYARCVTEWLVQWSDKAPERVFLAERKAAGGWKTLSYREAYGAVRRIGQALLDQRLGARAAGRDPLGQQHRPRPARRSARCTSACRWRRSRPPTR